MAITSLSGASAGMGTTFHTMKVGIGTTTAVPYTHFYAPGEPAAAAAPSPGMAGAALTSYAGQYPFNNPSSGNTYLGNLAVTGIAQGVFLLCDRLWHNSGINVTLTTPQAVTSVAWPARDANGSTNGEQVFIGLEVSGTMGAATPTITLDYTNSAGTAGRSAVNIVPTTSAAGIGFFYPIGVQDGDTGVRSIQNVTLNTSWISGTVHLVAYRIIARMAQPIANTNKYGAIDYITAGAPRFYDNSVPFSIYVPGGTTLISCSTALTYTRG